MLRVITVKAMISLHDEEEEQQEEDNKNWQMWISQCVHNSWAVVLDYTKHILAKWKL